MNKQKQTQELAKIEGWEKKPSEEWGYIWVKPNGYPYMSFTLPDYDSHDELQPIIDGMDDETFLSYGLCLQDVCEQYTEGYKILKATPAQKAEAILKAYGKWEVES